MNRFISISTLLLFSLFVISACEKQIDKVTVTYRIINFQDGFNVSYKTESDTLIKENVEGSYTLATPWIFSFKAAPGDIVYASMTDTVVNSYSRLQIMINGKVYKEKIRTDDRFMPVTASGIVPFE